MENTGLDIAPNESDNPDDNQGESNPSTLLSEPGSVPKINKQDEQPGNLPVVETSNSSELDRVLDAIESLARDFQTLQQGFDSKLKYDASKEKIIDALHAELQAYRDGLHFKILRPVFFDLISMHDDLSNILNYNPPIEGESETVGKLCRSLASFQDSIESVLERHGATVINEPGDQFVGKKQRAVRAEATDDPQKDRLICEHTRKGFEYEGIVLRPENVVLYKYVEKPVG
jgi:molecular chaperone GrpE